MNAPEDVLDSSASQYPPADTALLAKMDVREVCLYGGDEAFHQSKCTHDWKTRLFVRPWGFRLDEILVGGIKY